MKKKHILTISTAVMMIAASADAQESLMPSIVEAESTNESIDNEVTQQDLQQIQAVDLNDIFQKTPSVQVNGGRAQAQQVFVNGLESTLSNVTIDGASQGNLYHHAGSVLVDADLLKQVTVNSGAGNALQGLGALNGAIEFETKNAFDLLSEGDGFYGLGKVTYYSNGEGFKLSNTLAGELNDQWGVLFNATYVDRDSYEDGDGNAVDLTDYKTRNALLKLSGRFDGGHTLDIGLEQYFTKTNSYDRLNVTKDFLDETGRPTGDLQRVDLSREAFTLKYGFDPSGNDLLNFTTKAYYTNQGFERTSSNDKVDLESIGFTARNTSTFNDSFTMTYGVDFRKTESDVNYTNLTPARGSEEELAYGVFLQNDWAINDMLSLSFGGRYDKYDYDDYGGQNFDSGKFSPNVSINFQPIESLNFNLGYNEAYRGVGIREAFLAGSRPLDQDGEEAKAVKFSIDYAKQGFFVRGSYFDQSIDNYLYPIAEGRGGPNGSFGDITNYGYEIATGYEKDNFRVSLSVTDNSPDVEGYDYPDDLGVVVAGRRWIIDSSYDMENQGVTFGGNIEFREGVDEVLDSGGGFPAIAGKQSYTLVNAYVRWQVPTVSGLTLSLNVDNLFDKSYQDHTIFTSSGFNSPGREFRIGANYEF